MLQTIEKDILTVESGIICHQVNCLGSMGAGLAYEIRKLWPIVYKRYREIYESERLKLGVSWLTKVAEDLYVANLAAQLDYGKKQKVYTNYIALEKALSKFKEAAKVKQMYAPYGLGCGLAGGDWRTVYRILEKTIPEIIICKLPVYNRFEFLERLK